MKITYHITREEYIDAQKLHRAKGPSTLVRAIRLGAKVVAVVALVIMLGLAAVIRDRKHLVKLRSAYRGVGALGAPVSGVDAHQLAPFLC
jgi:hypothetical protein